MIIDCWIKAVLIFLIYNAVALSLFGVPKSLSMTYYLFKERSNSFKYLFPGMIVTICMLLIPSWIELSDGSNFQFMSFLSPAALMFVGFTPAFNDGDMYKTIHNIAAYTCATFAMLWIILVTPFWYVILIVLGVMIIAAIATNSWKTSYVYWLEMVAFVSLFIAIPLYHYIK